MKLQNYEKKKGLASFFSFFNPHDEEYQKIKEERDVIQLQEDYTSQPYHVENADINGVSHISSYFLNVISALTASTLVFLFFLELLNVWAAAMIVIIFFLLMEYAKRQSARKSFKDYYRFVGKRRYNYGMIALFACLMVTSIGFSFFGSKKAVEVLDVGPQLTNSEGLTEVQDIRTALAEKKQKLTDYQTKEEYKRSNGKIAHNISQFTIPQLEKDISRLEADLLAIQNEVRGDNKEVEGEHQSTIAINAHYFALATLGFELLFLVCIRFNEYYKYRKFLYYQQLVNKEKLSAIHSPTDEKDHSTASSFSANDLKLLIQEEVSRLTAPNVTHQPTAQRNQIGYKKEVVQQAPNPVAQPKKQPIADVKYWKQCAKTYYERSKKEWNPQSKQEVLDRNFNKHLEFVEMLNGVSGIEFEFVQCEREGKPSIEVIEKKEGGDDG